jgi:alanine-synthesizing transaminase
VELRRVDHLPQYVFSRIDELKAEVAARGVDVIDFGIGSPDVPTPAAVVERLVSEARKPRNHGYPTSAGMIEVREALAAWYERRHGVALDAATQTLVTWGASEALAHLPWVLLGPGDAALAPEPCYPIHRYALRFSGAGTLPVRMAPAGGAATVAADEPADTFDLTAEVERAWDAAPAKPRVALLSFPHNPTTRCVELADFARLVDFARARELVVIHDFAYADIAFEGYRPPSILQVPGADDVAVELVSLSKSHNMAGWRTGFVAGNAEVIAGLARLKSYLDYGVTKAVQLMALTALTECDDVPARMASIYQERRDVLCDGLTVGGWPVARPRGTMFVWARIPPAFRPLGSLAFAELLLREAGVAVSPGVGFTAGPDEGRDSWADEHMRFALVQPGARIATALEGIARVLAAGPPEGEGAKPREEPS